MPNLSESNIASKFVQMLDKCESNRNVLSEWEQGFIDGLREQFNERDTQLDMGMTPWNPSVNQWNTLHGIAAEKL